MRAACSRDVQPVMVDCKSAFFVDMKETGFIVWTSVKLQAESVNMTDSFHEEVLCVQKKKKKKTPLFTQDRFVCEPSPWELSATCV